MSDTSKLIKDYNFWAAGRDIIDAEAQEAIDDLRLDPINLSEYPAVTDLPFVGAR